MSRPFGQPFPSNTELSINSRNTPQFLFPISVVYKWLVTCFEIFYVFGDEISFVVSQLTGSFSRTAISRMKI